MKVLKGETIYLPAYLEDSSNDPVTGEALANIKFTATYTNNSGSPIVAQSATYELSGGWYSYNFSVPAGATDFTYWAEHTGSYKGFPGGVVEVVNLTFTNSTHSHSAGTSEQDVVVDEVTTERCIRGVRLDMAAVTKETTVRIKEEIDGSNYRTIDSIVWDTSMDNTVTISEFYTTRHVKLTAQSSVAESGPVNIPVTTVTEIF